MDIRILAIIADIYFICLIENNFIYYTDNLRYELNISTYYVRCSTS